MKFYIQFTDNGSSIVSADTPPKHPRQYESLKATDFLKTINRQDDVYDYDENGNKTYVNTITVQVQENMTEDEVIAAGFVKVG